MRAFVFSLCALAATAVALPAAAQENTNEIVVTAQRYQPQGQTQTIPWVSLTRRADFVVVPVLIVCDTREAPARAAELEKTVQAMVTRAKASGGAIALSIDTDGIVTDFDETRIATAVSAGGRPDTSQIFLTVKTPVRPDDTLDAARARILTFAKAVPTTGRTEVLPQGSTGLSVVRPGQYRYDLVNAMAADAAKITKAFGEGYAVDLRGMQSPISWRQTGPLEITLFLPHTMAVVKGD